MKTNLFKVREMNQNKIIVEEEQTKHPFLLFIKKHHSALMIILTILCVSTLGLGLGLSISLIGNTGYFDISYIEGDGQINANPGADDEDVEKELTGNIAITDGVVLVVKKIMTDNNDLITYYSDGTSLIITNKGIIKRVSSLSDGSYGIDEKGKINANAIVKAVTVTTNTLDDGTIISYYSDGSAEITKDDITIFVRNSANISFDLESTKQIFTYVEPSGVTLFSNKTINQETYKYTEFLDGSVLIEDGDKKYIIHNKEDINLDTSSYSFPNNNMMEVKSTMNLTDGNIIDYYNDGSAIITTSTNDKILVRKSGDIVISNNAIYEIVPNNEANAVSTITSPDGKVITYYDNGSAIVKRTDGTKEYVIDNSKIKYDENKNITSISGEKYDQLVQKTLEDGTVVTNFGNGKTQIIDSNGKDYIIDTDDLTYDISGDIEIPSTTPSEQVPTTPDNDGNSNDNEDTDIEIDMSEAENKYNYSKSLETSTFVITNKNIHSRKFRLVIEEVDDYSKYNSTSIATANHEAAYYVKYQATLGNTAIKATRLSDNKLTTSNGTNSYVIYEGVLDAKASINVSVILYIDYADLDNSLQNKSFIGTIKLYYVGK